MIISEELEVIGCLSIGEGQRNEE